LNIFWLQRINNRVRYFRSILFALAAFLWLPASMHCELETVPGLEFLSCDNDAQPSHSPCSDGCCSVEKSHYQFQSVQTKPALPNSTGIMVPLNHWVAKPLPIKLEVEISSSSPPELFAGWQFLSRTAASPRSPSVAS